MKRPGLLILFLLLLTPQVSAVNVWEHINTSREMYFIEVGGRSTGEPPFDPLNYSRITGAEIGYVYNDTHYLSVLYNCNYYSPHCGWRERFLPKHGNPTPFNFSIWNVTKVMEEYQWGLENYLPNITMRPMEGFEWPEKYWVRNIIMWNALINASKFRVILFAYASETPAWGYVVFECQNPENMTCNWKEPVVDVEVMIPPTTTTTTPKQEEKTCGPGLLIGLVLITLLIKQKKR